VFLLEQVQLSLSTTFPPIDSTDTMVVVKQLITPISMVRDMSNNEFRLNSARIVRFVGPTNVEINSFDDEDQYSIRKRSGSNQFQNAANDLWCGVQEFCQAIDDMIVVEKDTELFLGKSVLELGFSTGIPATLSMDCGASEIAVHCFGQSMTYVKATANRNLIPKTLCKFSSGELEACLTSMGGKKFDIILAPELINTNEKNFASIVAILDASLADNGLILLSGRSFYHDVSGSIQGFLDYIRATNKFDAFVRWTSTNKSDVAPRKLIQMTRSFR